MPRHTDPFALCARRGDRAPLRRWRRRVRRRARRRCRTSRRRPPSAASTTRPWSASPTDGRVLVAEQRGLVKSFSRASRHHARRPSLDLRPRRAQLLVERGLLGMALDPNFAANNRSSTSSTPTTPRSAARRPRCGHPARPTPRMPGPGWSFDGRVPAARSAAGSRASTLNGDRLAVRSSVLIEDWCQQYPSHTIGSLEFTRRRASTRAPARGRASASPTGARMAPTNPCGDPPGGVEAPAPPTAGRGAAQPGPAHRRRPGHPRRHGDPDRPGRPATGRGPATPARQPRPQHPADHRLGPSQPVPVRDLARRSRSGSATSAGTSGRS